jgi:hypothetical protein
MMIITSLSSSQKNPRNSRIDREKEREDFEVG